MNTRFALLLLVALSASISAQTAVSADNSQPPAPSRSVTGSSVGEALASADGLLKESKFGEAAAAYKAILAKEPTAANAHVGLIRSLLRSHQLTEAEEAGKQAIQTAPLSSLVHATYGDVNFTIGQMGVAEAEYRAALKLDPNAARGLYGMGRMYSMVSMHKRAKEVFAKAHEADPKDSQIYEAWVTSLPEAEQLEEVKKSAGDHPTEREQQQITFLSKVSQNKPWVLAGEPKRTELKLLLYGRTLQDGGLNGPRMIAKGFGVDVKFNGRAGATLLLDTGASGITIGRKLAEKAGVVKIADTFIRGIGDQGPVASYIGWADKINIGGIEFKNCVIEVSSKTDVADEAGLLGTDVFENFLITLDFKEQKLVLASLPKNPNGLANDDGPQDRYIAPEMQSFTKVWRFGHFLVLPVIVSDKASGNFMLDTGADTNTVDTKLAKQITKLSYEGYSLKGVSGSVKEVLNGDKAILQFGKLRVRSDDIPVIDLGNVGRSEDTEIAGFIGIRTLSQMKVTIDYRDGLVNFELYEFRPARE